MDRLIFIVIGAVLMAFTFSATVVIIGLLFDAESFLHAGKYLFWIGGAVGTFYGLTSYEEKI